MATTRKLNDTQLVILGAAARHPRGAAFPLPKGMDMGTDSTAKALEQLLKRELVAETAAEPKDQEWRRTESGSRLTLVITQAGLSAIGVSEAGADADQITHDNVEVNGKRNPAGSHLGSAKARGVRKNGPDRKHKTKSHRTKRTASESPASKDKTDGASVQKAATASSTATTITFGAGTKAAAVLNLLRRKNGASLVELAQSSGWQAHSVRGFLSGTLKKKHGLVIVGDKDASGCRRYRIAE